MKNLFSLLQRFSQSLNKDTLVKETISQVIFEKTNIKLASEKISLKNGVLEISTSPVMQNEIKLKEELIKTTLKEVSQINLSRVLYK